MAMTMAESQWSWLPRDILTLIAKRLGTQIDTLRLRSVCNSWRSSLAAFKHRPSFPLTLPFPICQNFRFDKNDIDHFILSQCTVYFILPPPQDHLSKCQKPWVFRVEDLSNGKGLFLDLHSWILKDNVPPDFPKVLNLLDFTVFEIGRAFSLDYVETFGFIPGSKNYHTWEVVVSSHPFTIGGDDFEVMAIFGEELGFIRLGDEEWKWIDDVKQPKDILYHNDKFFVLDREGNTFVITSDLKVVHIADPIPLDDQDITSLVKFGEDLYLIENQTEADVADVLYEEFPGGESVEVMYSVEKVQCKIYKLNEVDKKWDWVSSLGDQSFFVGDGCSYVVSAKDFAGLEPDTLHLHRSDGSFTGENENLGDSMRVALAPLKSFSVNFL